MKTNLKNFPNSAPTDLHYKKAVRQWQIGFEAELREQMKELDEWLGDTHNQPPCDPMPNFDWINLSLLYWARLWDMRDKFRGILGEGSEE